VILHWRDGRYLNHKQQLLEKPARHQWGGGIDKL
jgi:hypothetical protein